MIFIGFTHQFGRVDYNGIEEFRKNNEVDKVVIFCRKEPVDKIRKLAKDYEFIVSKNPVKDAKVYAKKLKESGRKVVVEDLQDFGERAIRDVC